MQAIDGRSLIRSMMLGGSLIAIVLQMQVLSGKKTVMDCAPPMFVYLILMIMLWCLYLSKKNRYGKTGPNERLEIREKQNVPALDTNEMPKCPCCGRPYYPVTDISGRQMCSWCGHYIRYRGRYGFYRNILNYLNNIDDVVI